MGKQKRESKNAVTSLRKDFENISDLKRVTLWNEDSVLEQMEVMWCLLLYDFN